ncbi:MAG: hypothetical protein N3J91_15275 [Verrucomicrobiae bacterium]|nr:hypothetical protein [Verrucomicrobiae bacterium]
MNTCWRHNPAFRPLWVSVLLALLGGWLPAATPMLRVLQSSPAAANRLQNAGFEQAQNGRPAGWSAYQRGFELVPHGGRHGTQGILCHNEQPTPGSGAAQTVVLNQAEPAPLLVQAWSKAENVSGSADNNYSLYVDLIYADGSPLWGQTANFRCGTHDWEKREVWIVPEKPVKQLTVYCLFRGHTGKVWFDDLRLEELRPEAGASFFQGAFASRPPEALAPPPPPARTVQTSDGLRLEMAGDYVLGGSWPRGAAPGGFMVRDVARASDFLPFQNGQCPELGLRLDYTLTPRSNHLVVTGRLTDTTDQDRAVTLVFALPVGTNGFLPDSLGDHFGPVIRPPRAYRAETQVKCGATGTLALYPVFPMWQGNTGLALGLDMAKPAIYRLGYDHTLQWLWIAYDFGLAPDTRNFPRAAEFQFVLYHFPGAQGFRGAWQKYMEIFPDHFVVRSRDQGIWMPFTDISTVQDWQDFGFKYHEGNNNVPFDDAHGILSFRYTEPMTWWMPMPKETPRNREAALKIRDELLERGKPNQRTPAQVTLVAAMQDEDGHPALLFRNEPWCDGAIWSLNPNPHLPGPVNFAQWHWSEDIKKRLYGPDAKGQLDGEYLDSLEGYVTTDLNYRRDHFAHTTVPLTFATETRRLALFKGLAVFEFTRWFCDDVHRLGKLTFANGVPYRFTFLCPWLDIMGTETDWNHNGQWNPPGDATLSLWRFMAGAKPYVLLMNTHYDAFTPDLVEKYFQRCAFYGFFPSMFSHNASENPYWQNPKWYNRDRPLFRKYIPIIKETAEAGWRPVTGVSSDNPALWLERFGTEASPAIYVTAFNPTAQTQSATLRWQLPHSTGPGSWKVEELITARPIEFAATTASWPCTLKPEQAAVFKITPSR